MLSETVVRDNYEQANPSGRNRVQREYSPTRTCCYRLPVAATSETTSYPHQPDRFVGLI